MVDRRRLPAMRDPEAWRRRVKAEPGRRRFLAFLAATGTVFTRVSVIGGVWSLVKDLWATRPAPAPVVVTPPAARVVAILPAIEIDVALPITPVKGSGAAIVDTVSVSVGA
jgi:hypothetical protein